MISEGVIGALVVALLTGAALTLTLNSAFGNLGMALSYSAPATLVLGGILALLATDKIKPSGKKPPPKEANEGE